MISIQTGLRLANKEKKKIRPKYHSNQIRARKSKKKKIQKSQKN